MPCSSCRTSGQTGGGPAGWRRALPAVEAVHLVQEVVGADEGHEATEVDASESGTCWEL